MNLETSSGQRPPLSIVVPAFNEENRFHEPIAKILRYLDDSFPDAELIVVDDGSQDFTFDIAKSLATRARIPMLVCRYPENRGKGHALKVGFEIARGETILFCDADLATPIEEAARLLDALKGGAQIAIGSRKMEGATITRHQSWIRENLGKIFTWVVRKSIADVSDVTCGFKAFLRDHGRDLFRRVRIYDWTFDAEILLLAHQQGLRISEIPVRWADAPGTKVRLIRDSARSLANLVRLKRNHHLGAYDSENVTTPPLDIFHNDAWCEIPKESRRNVA